MHSGGHFDPDNFKDNKGRISYSDSKLYVVMLAKATAKRWPDVYSNAVDPGWVPTKMGGAGAPDNLQKGYETQSWLAVSNDKNALVSGRYFYHKEEKRNYKEADNTALQNKLIYLCEEITGVTFPEN